MHKIFSFLRSNTGQIARYAVVGTAGTAVDLGVLYALVEWFAVPVLWATAAAFFAAVVHNYILNKTWTFAIKETKNRKLFVKFLSVALVGLGLTLGLMWLLVYAFGVPYLPAKVLTSGLVVGWNFLANKFWTFRVRSFAVRPRPADGPFLSVIVPAYNEQARLGATLTDILQWRQTAGLDAEVIVVDDGSIDDTIAVAKTALRGAPKTHIIEQPKNLGKGAAVAAGMLAAGGRWRLFMDADSSTPVAEVEKLLAYAEDEKTIVIGSRHANRMQIEVDQSAARKAIGRFGNWLIRLLLLDGIDDTQCGFKLFPYAAAQQVFLRQKVQRWGFDFEALMLADNLGYTIKEVPVSWTHHDGSQFHPLRDAVRTFAELLYVKANLWLQRYD